MIITATAKRYARALFELAYENKSHDEVLIEFKDFFLIVEQDKDLKSHLKMPNVIQRDLRLVQYLKKNYSEIFFRFIKLTLKNNRYSMLKQILFEYQKLHDKFNNRLKAEVVTAISLSESLTDELHQKLNEYFNANVRIENKVDPSILGGIIIKTNGLVFDASVLEKFNKLSLHLTNI